MTDKQQIAARRLYWKWRTAGMPAMLAWNVAKNETVDGEWTNAREVALLRANLWLLEDDRRRYQKKKWC